jgi:hypothetical protein
VKSFRLSPIFGSGLHLSMRDRPPVNEGGSEPRRRMLPLIGRASGKVRIWWPERRIYPKALQARFRSGSLKGVIILSASPISLSSASLAVPIVSKESSISSTYRLLRDCCAPPPTVLGLHRFGRPGAKPLRFRNDPFLSGGALMLFIFLLGNSFVPYTMVPYLHSSLHMVPATL